MDVENHHQLAEAIRASRRDAIEKAAANQRWQAALVDETEVAFKIFTNLLASDGVRAALYSLLRRTDYRFIAIFRFQNGKATSVVYVDRESLGDFAGRRGAGHRDLLLFREGEQRTVRRSRRDVRLTHR